MAGTAELAVFGLERGGDIVLRPQGVLDATTFGRLRDAIVKTAIETPRAVIVAVDDLAVPSGACWSVFASARWHVSVWPDVPVVVVSGDANTRRMLRRSGITRYVPVFETEDDASRAVAAGGAHRRRRARLELPAETGSKGRISAFVAEALRAWELESRIDETATLAVAMVEAAIDGFDGFGCSLRLECDGSDIAVAVSRSRDQTGDGQGCGEVSPEFSTRIDRLCRLWGCAPTPDGATVWALIRGGNPATELFHTA
ncbi:anti-anti-sigma regulatory factor (antagonist of anti-sigma factor) [Mycolicibacterium chubuense NBB4]|uniref:Anti-anti-sigma regulatory factor (Antagonist of anti-sigma factor) n=1 Tax=Mycolicibacterium chubuense (strain NBB4) TaxID=710421 RepID=I4BGT8_MYCCN|nr:STAS domain-containing protein [Mycolicibacterium chubuense]AFM16495.1 anti-anti-sigma regulatory factor (antagonist of anti-sigma factor) [Mycolicibacterium chubuense NBB4]